MTSIDGLAAVGNAPKIFLKTTRHGLPYVAVTTSSLFTLLGYMGIKAGSGRVFGWFSNMTAISGLNAWFGIGVLYLRFYQGLKAQGIDRRTLPYYSRLQPYAAWYALILCVVISLVSMKCWCPPVYLLTSSVQFQLSGWEVFLKGGWATDTFITNYLPLILFPILYLGAKYYYRQPIKKAHEMDFVTNIKEIEATTYALHLHLFTPARSLTIFIVLFIQVRRSSS